MRLETGCFAGPDHYFGVYPWHRLDFLSYGLVSLVFP